MFISDTRSHSPSRQECYVHHVVSVYIMLGFYYDVDDKYRPVGSPTTTYISVYPSLNLLLLDFPFSYKFFSSTLKLKQIISDYSPTGNDDASVDVLLV